MTDYLKEAQAVHAHLARIRKFVIRGGGLQELWKGSKKEPTFAQIKTMITMATVGPAPLTAIAEALDISKGAASEMIDRLYEAGFVTREVDPDDRRKILVDLTDEAKLGLQRHEDYLISKIQWLMQHIDPELVESWVSISDRINVVLEKENFEEEYAAEMAEKGEKHER